MEIETVDIGELHEDPANVRVHPERNIAAIKGSLARFGQVKPVVIDAQNVVRAGNGTLRAARELGWRHVKCVRTKLAGSEATAYGIADNRTAETAAWDDAGLVGQLRSLKEEGFGLGELGFGDDDFAELAKRVSGNGPVQEDEPPVVRPDAFTRTGDLWILGNHRVLCGDSTKREDVDRVMAGEKMDMVFTDPPYGHHNNNGDLINRREAALGKPKSKSSAARPIANDGAEANDVVRAVFSIVADLLKPGSCCCCCCGGGGPDPQFARWSLWLDEVIPFKMCVVWDKGGLGMGWHYRRNWECILIAEKPGAACKWYGGHDVPNVIRDIGKIIPSAEQHPTEKPVALPAFFMELHSLPGDVVFEPFLGSGSTLVAAEQLGRHVRGIDLEPSFIDMTLRRWAKLTGKTPTRESDGASFPVGVPVEVPS